MNINTNIIFLLIGLVSFNACSQGTQNAPYQLSDISYTDTLKGVWIKGYIVGGMKKSRDMIKSTGHSMGSFRSKSRLLNHGFQPQ